MWQGKYPIFVIFSMDLGYQENTEVEVFLWNLTI